MCLLHLLRSMCMSFIYLVKCPPKKNLHKVSHIFFPSNGPHQRESIFNFCLRPLFVAFLFFSLRKVYPKAPCFIDTPSGAHDKHNLRGKSVLAALKASGAPNPLELRGLVGLKRKDPRCFEVRSIYAP